MLYFLCNNWDGTWKSELIINRSLPPRPCSNQAPSLLSSLGPRLWRRTDFFIWSAGQCSTLPLSFGILQSHNMASQGSMGTHNGHYSGPLPGLRNGGCVDSYKTAWCLGHSGWKKMECETERKSLFGSSCLISREWVSMFLKHELDIVFKYVSVETHNVQYAHWCAHTSFFSQTVKSALFFPINDSLSNTHPISDSN